MFYQLSFLHWCTTAVPSFGGIVLTYLSLIDPFHSIYEEAPPLNPTSISQKTWPHTTSIGLLSKSTKTTLPMEYTTIVKHLLKSTVGRNVLPSKVYNILVNFGRWQMEFSWLVMSHLRSFFVFFKNRFCVEQCRVIRSSSKSCQLLWR